MLRSLDARANGVRRSTWWLFVPLAVLHFTYAFALDYGVWQWWQQEEVFRSRMNPWQMNIAPYLPGCILLQHARGFDPRELDYRRGTNPGIAPIMRGLGLLLVAGGALGTGLFTESLVRRLRHGVSRPWGLYSWRLYAAVILWLGWTTVPTKISLYYQWAHWITGRSLV